MANGCRPWDRGRSREEEAASEESTATEAVTEEAAEEDMEADSEDAGPLIVLPLGLLCKCMIWKRECNVLVSTRH